MSQVDVSIAEIAVSYGETVPIEDLSLDVHRNEFLSLLGPSGCGKTTTLRTVAGFVTPSKGDVRIGGRSVLNEPPNRRNIGMVYQDYALFPHLTVEENIAFGMKMRKMPSAEIQARVPKIIAQLQLSGLGRRYPAQLSGGQQQRVALARALVFAPSVLLLDEPLAALDKQLRADMQFELRQLQRSIGITTMFVTHDQEEALSLSDRIAVMNQGKILQVDSPRAVYDFPARRFVAEFIGVANFLTGQVVDRGRDHAAVAFSGLSGQFRVSGRHTDGPVEVLIRPENLRLCGPRSGSDGNNVMTGRVVNSVFTGTAIKYQVAVASGAILRVDSPVDSGGIVPLGEEVALAWYPDQARIFRDGILER